MTPQEEARRKAEERYKETDFDGKDISCYEREAFIAGYTADRWIDCKLRLPESGECVLLYSEISGVAEGAWLSSNNIFEQWRWNTIMRNVTHWQPLPKPPKTNEG